MLILAVSGKGYAQTKNRDSTEKKLPDSINYSMEGLPAWFKSAHAYYITNPLLIVNGIRYDYNPKTDYPQPPSTLEELLKDSRYKQTSIVRSKQEMKQMNIDTAYTCVLILQ